MGSGKTTVGKKLAKKLNKEFIDMDQWIEKDEEMPVEEIFEKKGENLFRELETKYIRKLSNKKKAVISTGGGAPCHSDNMEFMNDEGLTIYLEMKSEVLLFRLQNSKKERPLLKNKTSEEMLNFIQNKLAERESYYNKANIIINGFNVNINDLAEKIKNIKQ